LKIGILKNKIKLLTYFKLKFIKTSINLEGTLLDMKDVAAWSF
jgi:hypothetical protein